MDGDLVQDCNYNYTVMHGVLNMSLEDKLRGKMTGMSYEPDNSESQLSAEKASATKRKEPWVGVLDIKVNEENVRNGFIELDWNEYFIEALVDAGYIGEKPEEIVDKWFRTIISQMMVEDGYSGDVNAGYINVHPISKTHSEAK